MEKGSIYYYTKHMYIQPFVWKWIEEKFDTNFSGCIYYVLYTIPKNKLEEHILDERFFSLVRILDILGVHRWNRCTCLVRNHVLWLVEVSPGNTQIPSVLTTLKNLMSKVLLVPLIFLSIVA